MEFRRNEASEERDPTWSKALETRRVGGSGAAGEGLADGGGGGGGGDDEEESSGSDSEGGGGGGGIAVRANKGKLSRADLNRRARHRASLNLAAQARRRKAMLAAIANGKGALFST